MYAIRSYYEVSADFLTGENQINLLALHGTPLAADPVNMVYLGISHLVSGMYDNVYAATVEGVPNIQSVANQIKKDHARTPFTRIRLIPMMFLAGRHVEKDLMGEKESWRTTRITSYNVCYTKLLRMPAP